MILENNQFERLRTFIYQHGRLLERKLFEYCFSGGDRQACLSALRAYQNPDGGFGNGIEPDLLCPDSSAIGAETALYVVDLLDAWHEPFVQALVGWLDKTQNERGVLPHPPDNLTAYPYQPWWGGPDDHRVLVLAAQLQKGAIGSDVFYRRARSYFESVEAPKPDDFYAYPHYAYLRYCSQNDSDPQRLVEMNAALPGLLENQRDHYPLFSRYWFYAADQVGGGLLAEQAQAWVDGLQPDGGLLTPYPDLPWWRPIFTLDGMIMLRRFGFF